MFEIFFYFLSLFFALCSLFFFQAAKQREILAELRVLKQQLNELKPKETLRAQSSKLRKIWMKRSAFQKQQIVKQFISTALDEYERLSEKVSKRKPGSDGLIEDRDLLFP